jgi:hypothetical protein
LTIRTSLLARGLAPYTVNVREAHHR